MCGGQRPRLLLITQQRARPLLAQRVPPEWIGNSFYEVRRGPSPGCLLKFGANFSCFLNISFICSAPLPPVALICHHQPGGSRSFLVSHLLPPAGQPSSCWTWSSLFLSVSHSASPDSSAGQRGDVTSERESISCTATQREESQQDRESGGEDCQREWRREIRGEAEEDTEDISRVLSAYPKLRCLFWPPKAEGKKQL